MTKEEAIARIKDHKIIHKINEPRAIYISEALDMAIQALKEEPDPCDFCETIYPDADIKDIVFRQGKYSDFNKYGFISIDDEGKYYINAADSADPYEIGYLCDIKFCPYCGRKLAESEDN